MKKPNIIERIASAISATLPAKAQATSLSTVESERVFRQSRDAAVIINLPSVSVAVAPTSIKSTPPPRRLVGNEYFIAAGEGLPQPTKSEMATLRELQMKWNRASKATTEQFTPDAAQKHFRQISQEEWRKAYETGVEPEHLNLTSEAQVTDQFAAKRQYAERSLEDIQLKAEEVCAPIRRYFIAAAVRHLESLERSEREEFEKFGVAWNTKSPSPRITALRSLIARLRSSTINPGQSSPKNLLPYLQFD